ncbi:MAG: hypothetical protein AAFP98_09095 [Pseudomonadota bacterium]
MRTLPLILAIFSAAPAFADTSLAGLQDRVVGQWRSLGCEMRPAKDPETGGVRPTYLTRDFTYDADGGFSADIAIYAEPSCTTQLNVFSFAGEIAWHDENPAVPGAWSQDYILNAALTITPTAQPIVDQMNSLPAGACGDAPYVLNEAQDILGKPCVLVTILEGNDYVVDHDLLYVRADAPNLLFMGGKHVDGTGFYAPDTRPTIGLQQPLIRVE